MAIRVYQWNIQSCVGMDGSYNPKQTAAQIAKSDADVVTLQEVSRLCLSDRCNKQYSDARKKDDQALILAQLTGMEYFFASKTSEFGGEYGNCILSRLPILRKEKRVLESSAPHHHGNNLFSEPLMQVACAIQVSHPELGLMWIVSVQLGRDASGKEQADEVSGSSNWEPFMCPTWVYTR